MTVPPLDRVTIVTAAMQALLADDVRPSGDLEAVGTARIVCDRGGVIAGLPLVAQIFGRAGVRCRASAVDGDVVAPGDEVGRLGGPLAAIEAAGATALRTLERLSAIASGAAHAVEGDPIEAHAAAHRLSTPDRVGDDGPVFQLES